MPHQYPTIVLQMSEQPLNLPSTTIPPQLPTILRPGLLPVLPMRRDHLDALLSQLRIQRITIVSPIPYKSLWSSFDVSRCDSLVYKFDFMRASRRNVEGDTSTSKV